MMVHYFDKGELEVIGEGSVMGGSINIYKCKVCNEEFDDTSYDEIGTLKSGWTQKEDGNWVCDTCETVHYYPGRRHDCEKYQKEKECTDLK